MSYDHKFEQLTEKTRDLWFEQYTLVESRCLAEDCGNTTVYGIGLHGKAEQVVLIADVSSIRERVQGLIDLCNRNEVSVGHLREVAEDFLL